MGWSSLADISLTRDTICVVVGTEEGGRGSRREKERHGQDNNNSLLRAIGAASFVTGVVEVGSLLVHDTYLDGRCHDDHGTAVYHRVLLF